jgi:hypothetical protein
MSELLREQTSAFVDDALPSEETALLLRRLHEDVELTRTFACYHLIGAAMRQEPDASVLAGRVRTALRDETMTPARRSPRWQRLLKPALGVAVAASVAVFAITALRVSDSGGTAPVVSTAGMTGGHAPEPASYTVAPRTNDVPTEIAGRARLVKYVMRHGNYANMPNSPVMNYRGVVGGQYPPSAESEDQAQDDSDAGEPQVR